MCASMGRWSTWSPKLTEVKINLTIEANDKLETISRILREVNINLFITSAVFWDRLMPGLKRVGGTLRVLFNNSLESFPFPRCPPSRTSSPSVVTPTSKASLCLCYETIWRIIFVDITIASNGFGDCGQVLASALSDNELA